MTLQERIAVAESLACSLHAGQVDKQGHSYVFHPARVAASVPEEYQVVAWLHDVLEDCPQASEQLLLEQGIEPQEIETVKLLTRKEGQKYADYIEGIRVSGNKAAIAVKLADLRDNLRPGGPEGLGKRYLKAISILSA